MRIDPLCVDDVSYKTAALVAGFLKARATEPQETIRLWRRVLRRLERAYPVLHRRAVIWLEFPKSEPPASTARSATLDALKRFYAWLDMELGPLAPEASQVRYMTRRSGRFAGPLRARLLPRSQSALGGGSMPDLRAFP